MNMKLASVALSGALLVSGASFGLDCDPKFYVGGEAQYNNLKGGKNLEKKGEKGNSLLHKKKSPGAGLFLGARVTENFGAEIGYSALKKSHNTSTVSADNTLDVKMNNPYVDAMGYIPVADNLELIGSLGVGRLSTKLEQKNKGVVQALSNEMKKLAKSKAGVRVGLGAQYKLTDNVGARFMVRHQKGNKTIKSVNSAGLGLFYQF